MSVTIPKTDLVTSRLGFGTASLHHLPSLKQRILLLSTALDSGLTHFDTAPLYGEGMAERSLGVFLSSGNRTRVTLATKVGLPARRLARAFPAWMYFEKAATAACRRLGFSQKQGRYRSLAPTAVEKSFSQSLRNLRTDFVDILFIHDPVMAEVSDIRALAPWLELQKKSGRCRYLGLAGKASECVAVSRAVPGLFDVTQVEDSTAGREADALVTAGFPLQITYGYWRLARQPSAAHRQASARSSILEGALRRNRAGVVLLSTRKPVRIAEWRRSLPAETCT